MATTPSEAAPSTQAVTLVTQTRVPPEHNEQFTRWLQDVEKAVARFPGYLEQSALPPSPPAQADWVVAQRFTSAEAARGWVQSAERLRLLQEIQPLLLGQDDVHLVTDGSGPMLAAPVTAVISMRVRPGQEEAFVQWQQRIAAAEAEFEGFSGYKLEPPIPGVQDDWVTLLRFDSDQHLDAWLTSEQRQRLLEETPKFSTEYHTRKMRSGFDSWFTSGKGPDAVPPPVWKQSMIVLLVLYPTVFLFGFFVGTPWLTGRGVPGWLALFLGNAVSTVLLAYPFVPQVSRWLDWWLNPGPSASPRVTWYGVGLIALLYVGLLAIFSQFP